MPAVPAQPLSSTPIGTPVRRSLTFVVHGVGEQPKSSELQIATEGFLPLIRRRLDPEAIISARPADSDGPAEVVIEFDDHLVPSEHDKNDYEARFTEVWWQAAFGAPGLGEMLKGFVSILVRWGKTQGYGAEDDKDRGALLGFALAFGFLLLRLVLNILLFLPLMVFVVVAGTTFAVLAFVTCYRTTPTGPFALPTWVKSPLLRVFDLTTKAQPLIVEIGVLLLSPLIVDLLLLLWLFEAVLPKGSLGKLESLHVWLVKLITRSWGDLWLYVERPWQASRIRVRFEEQFAEAIGKLDRNVGTVAIIAHSMGSAIVYEALTGPRLRPLLEETFGPDPDTARLFGKPRLHLITLGSALNIVWTVTDRSERHRFLDQLPAYVDWLNLWTYLDPYARQALQIPDEAYEVRPSSKHPDIWQPVRESEVINQQDMFSDHSAYWNNASQVISPILDILTAAKLTQALRMDIPARMMRVSVLSFCKSLAWSLPVFVFAGLFAFVHGFNGGDNWPGNGTAGLVLDVVDRLVEETPEFVREVVGVVVSVTPEPLLNLLPEWLRDGVTDVEIQAHLFSPFIIGALMAAVATMVYSTAVKWVWDLWDNGHKYDRPRG